MVEYVPPALFLSCNSKTGYSVNVAIAHTCRPTQDCSRYCYGMESRIRLLPALTRQAENYARFKYLSTAHPEVLRHEALVMAHEVQAKQNFLRFFGVGDLQDGSVRFINALAEAAPSLALWVASRHFSLAAKLDVRPNLHVMLSLDASTPTSLRERATALVQAKGPTFYLAWVQQHATECIPPDVRVSFAEHHPTTRALWTLRKADLRTCPATVLGGVAHEAACASCRYCFDNSVRTQRAHGPSQLMAQKTTRIRRRP